MTNQHAASSSSHGFTVRITAALLLVAGVAGCSSFRNAMEPERVDYKSAGKVSAPKLDIPPDLTQLQRDNRYAIPSASNGTVTASGYNLAQSAHSGDQDLPVAERSTADMRIERDGTQRWLVIKDSPEVLWPKIKTFWLDSGFQLTVDSPDTGVMETDWAENRAKIPQDFIRNALGKALDSIYSTGERDKFRTRIERGANGLTEVYISHRGAEEVLTGSAKDTSIWTARPEDPQLEAEFLSRLMIRLGSDQKTAEVAVATAAAVPDRAHIAQDPNGVKVVVVTEGFERTWRRVGLALDRVGFTVENRDVSKGLYYVRYVNQQEEANDSAKKPGFFSNLFSSSKPKDKVVAQYQIAVRGDDANTQVSVQDTKGQFDKTPVAEQILKLLNEQLK